jgi:hypothetical protein
MFPKEIREESGNYTNDFGNGRLRKWNVICRVGEYTYKNMTLKGEQEGYRAAEFNASNIVTSVV